jgi:hypothetical protein
MRIFFLQIRKGEYYWEFIRCEHDLLSVDSRIGSIVSIFGNIKKILWQISFNRFGRKLRMGVATYIYNTNSSKNNSCEVASGKFLYCNINNNLIR